MATRNVYLTSLHPSALQNEMAVALCASIAYYNHDRNTCSLLEWTKVYESNFRFSPHTANGDSMPIKWLVWSKDMKQYIGHISEFSINYIP